MLQYSKKWDIFLKNEKSIDNTLKIENKERPKEIID